MVAIGLCLLMVGAGVVMIVRRPAAMPRFGVVRYLAGSLAAGRRTIITTPAPTMSRHSPIATTG